MAFMTILVLLLQILLADNCGIPPTTCSKGRRYRTLDGSCNNLEHPQWGIANSTYARLMPPIYGDGIQMPTLSVSGHPLPNARLLSYTIYNDQPISDPQYTLLNMQWGQIVAHDISLALPGPGTNLCCTAGGQLTADDIAGKPCFPILIPPDDPVYSNSDVQCMQIIRTLTNREAGCNYNDGPAEQLSLVTGFMDLSLVYGNSVEENRQIRAFQGGRMITDERDGRQWMPQSKDPFGDCDIQEATETCYLSGDIRVNQNPGLVLLQTILLKEHNRIAHVLAKLNPHWGDNVLFEEARRINIAQFQHINYYEWLPPFLGTKNMRKRGLIYKERGASVHDYDSRVNPTAINEYANAAFRYFHTQIAGRLNLTSEKRDVTGCLRLSDWYNLPSVIEDGDNFDLLVIGHVTQLAELTDLNYDKEIKQYLLRANRTLGSDLRAVDIQRNRDHGLASYNHMREFCGLKKAIDWKDFEDLIDPKIVQKLSSLYESPDDVDLAVGGTLEALVPHTLAGPTFLCILTEQFYRTRVGDRYFYENGNKLAGFTRKQLREIRKASAARVMCDNSGQMKSIQRHAFLAVSNSNPIVPCAQIPQVDLSLWIDKGIYS